MTRYCLWGARRGFTQLQLAPPRIRMTLPSVWLPASELAKRIDWATRIAVKATPPQLKDG